MLVLPDKMQTVKKMLEAVLAEFEVSYEWSKQTHHVLTAEIWVGNKRLTHTYTDVEYRVGFDARADLRRKLMLVNAPLKKPLNTFKPSDILDARLSVPMAREQTTHTQAPAASIEPAATEIPTFPSPTNLETLVESVATKPKPWNDTRATKDASVDDSASAVFPEPVTPEPSPPIRLNSKTLYHSVVLAPAEVLVIHCPNGLIVPEGDVFIIPLHDPTLHLHMPLAQFHAMFRQVEQPSPSAIEELPPSSAVKESRASAVEVPAMPEPKVPEPAIVVDTPPPPIVAPPPPIVDAPVVHSQPIREAETPKPFFADEVEEPRQAPPPPPPPIAKPVFAERPVMEPRKTPAPAGTEPISTEIRNVDGISAQIARHMAAIAHVQRVENREKIAARETANLLDERDYKQVSARMPIAWKLGFANRHESSQGQPLQYSISPAGHALLQRLGAWPWLREGLPVPKWANF